MTLRILNDVGATLAPLCTGLVASDAWYNFACQVWVP
jgi:hypothetical protein